MKVPEGYVDSDEGDGLPEDNHDWEDDGGSEEEAD